MASLSIVEPVRVKDATSAALQTLRGIYGSNNGKQVKRKIRIGAATIGLHQTKLSGMGSRLDFETNDTAKWDGSATKYPAGIMIDEESI